MITEFVNFKVPEITTTDLLIAKVDILNDFQKNQDGFVDAELVRGVEGDAWCLVYHYESMEKMKAIGEKMRSSKIFDEFIPVTVPGSVSVTFFNQLRKWQSE